MKATTREKLTTVQYRLLSIVTGILLLVVMMSSMSYFYNVVALLGVSIVLTYILMGPVGLIDKVICRSSQWLSSHVWHQKTLGLTPRVHTRLLAVIITYVLFFSIISVAAIRLGPMVARQVQGFSADLPRYVAQAELVLVEWSDHVVGKGLLRQMFQSEINEAAKTSRIQQASGEAPITEDEKQVIHESIFRQTLVKAMSLIGQGLGSAMDSVIDVVTGTVNGFFYALACLLLVFYFLLEGGRMRAALLSILPHAARSTADFFLSSFHTVMFAFIKGQVLLGMATGTYMFIIYSIFHVKYAIFLGMIFAVAEILPVVGTWIGITPGLMVILFSDEPMNALWVWLCSYCYQTIKDNVIAPKVVGDVMGLHPVVVILALVICAKIAGLLGVLLALPLASCLQLILRYLCNRDEVQTEMSSAEASRLQEQPRC